MIPTALSDRIRNEIEDLKLDGDIRRELEAWLHADREFNVWFLETTKGKLDDDALMGLLEGYREDQEAVESAWADFWKDRDEAALTACLVRSRAKMVELQER
ncbi:MAG: hypothetical protein KC657_31180 [Myxococcales bacterium]|nr:hypothetical protein [Myxococcales bacterium]